MIYSILLTFVQIKDKNLANLVRKFISRVEVHPSIESQFRALRIIQHIADHKTKFISYIREHLFTRWRRVVSIITSDLDNRFTIKSYSGQFYLLLKCNHEENCYDLMVNHNIIGVRGEEFGLEPGRYIRLDMVSRDTSFEIIIIRLISMIRSNIFKT
jgi:aspartate/methionine/tyrosine aminotransferase